MNKYLLSFSLLILITSQGYGQASFVENKGQWPDGVKYKAALSNGSMWIEEGGFTYQFFDTRILDYVHPGGKRPQGDPVYRQHSYKMRFEGTDKPVSRGDKKQSYYLNYFMGSDSARWASNVSAYSSCYYEKIYNGIDLRLYSKVSTIKYDFIVHKGGRAEDIAWSYDGDIELSLDRGQLKIKTSVNEVIENEPYAYQIINGIIRDIECIYILTGNKVSFLIGDYDENYDLVIDPEIAFATYVGSTANNWGATACADSQSNLISSATVFDSGYPTTLGAFEDNFDTSWNNYVDLVISKFSPDGSQLLYSTYIGGSAQETAHSLVADGQDNFLLLGVTGSSNFPTTSGVYQSTFVGGPFLDMDNLPSAAFFPSAHQNGCDFFISKFSPAGLLSNSTYVGGSSNDGLNYSDQLFYNYGDAFRGEINIDANNNVFVASVTEGNFPMAGAGPQSAFGGGLCDGILFKMNASLSALLFSTYLGGSGNDAAYAIEFAPDGTLLASGGTKSSNFPHTSGGNDNSFNGQTDGFVVRINPATFALLSGTFIGTTDYDQVYFVQTDQAGNIYALGQTAGSMPISPGVYGQPNSGLFIRKFNPTLTTILWNTTIGTGSGEIDISPTAFLVSNCSQIYFSGWGGDVNSTVCGGQYYTCKAMNSTTFGLPTTPDAFQSTTDGSDFYLCVLSPDAGSLVYASFLGGTSSAEHVDGGTSRFDKNGSVFQAVCAGCWGNSDFPTTPNAWSQTNNSSQCNMAVFRFNLSQAAAVLQIDGPSTVCAGSTAQFLNLSEGATDYQWFFGDGQASQLFEPGHIYNQAGDFEITLIATDSNGCFSPDTATIIITVIPPVNPSADTPGPICAGQPVQLQATGSSNLFWLPDPTLSATNIPNPTANPQVTTTYYAVDFNNCSTDTVSVTVVVAEPASTITPDVDICIGHSTTLQATGGVIYQWTPVTGLSSPGSATTDASPTVTTTYTVSITTADGCEMQREVTVTVFELIPGGNTYPEERICQGNSVTLHAEDAMTWIWSPAASLNNAFIQNPVASPFDTTTYFVTLTNPCGTGVSQVTVDVLVSNVQLFGGGAICPGQSVEAYATGAVSYLWQPSVFANPPNESHTFLSPPESMSFTLMGVDENGCASLDSVYVFVQPMPQVNAGPDQYFDYPGVVYLYGNANGFDYFWSPPDDLSCTDCPYPEASPDEPRWYYLHVSDMNGCQAIDSVFVKPYFPVWVPNTITPNNDGINDVFQAYGHNIEGFHMSVFDRWGNKIFESTDISEAWDGGINGYYVQNDVYVWVIEYDSLERRTKLVGHVNVLR